MNLPQRPRAQAFWKWWQTHLPRTAAVADANDPIFDRAVELLRAYDNALGLEVSIREDGTRRIVITAYGNAEHRQSVLGLMEFKPAIAPWDALAFRPHQREDFELEVGRFKFACDAIRFEPLRDSNNPDYLGLEVFFEGQPQVPEDVGLTAAGIAVMSVLGEERFMDEVNQLVLGDPTTTDVHDLIPLRQLGQFIEWSRRASQS